MEPQNIASHDDDMHFRFLDLPAELRNHIYDFIVAEPNSNSALIRIQSQDRSLRGAKARIPAHHRDIAMTQVCQLIRTEFRLLWQLSIRMASIQIEELDAYPSVFHSPTKRSTEPFTLYIALGALYHRNHASAKRTLHLMPLLGLMAENAQVKCHIWFQMTRLRRVVFREAARDLRRLLCPFFDDQRSVWKPLVLGKEVQDAVLRWDWFGHEKPCLTVTLAEGSKTSPSDLRKGLSTLPFHPDALSLISVVEAGAEEKEQQSQDVA